MSKKYKEIPYKLIDSTMLTKKQAQQWCNANGLRLPIFSDFKNDRHAVLFSDIKSIWLEDCENPVEGWHIAIMFEPVMKRVCPVSF